MSQSCQHCDERRERKHSHVNNVMSARKKLHQHCNELRKREIARCAAHSLRQSCDSSLYPLRSTIIDVEEKDVEVYDVDDGEMIDVERYDVGGMMWKGMM